MMEKQSTGYTTEERQQIAAQIQEYIKQGKIHTVIQAPEWMPKDLKQGTPLVEVIRTATSADSQWLEMIARDVLGLIDHES